MASLRPLFGIWDYVVVVIVLIISSAIGIYYRFTGGKQKTVQEFLLADKNMPVFPVAVSLMATFMSAITLLGVSSENYTYGFQFFVVNIAYGFLTPVAAYLYLPVFFKLQATSAYEYLEKRFGKLARLAASLSYSVQMIFYMGIVLYSPALALEALTGISRITAVLSVGLVCTFYSAIGGIKAVLMTDVFQSLLMFAAVLSIIISAWIDQGSLSEIWKIASEGGRTEFWNFNPDPTVRHTWFTLCIGGGVTFMSLYAVNQTQVQRYLTVKDLRTAQKALFWNWPISTALSFLTCFSGLAIYSKYYKCDPYEAKYITNIDQLMPYYVMDTMGNIPGLSGLFVAGIFSASLSTISGAVNSLAAVTIEDYYKPLHLLIYKKPALEEHTGVKTKVVSLVYGLVCVAVAFLAQFLGGVLQAALTIFGVIGGPLLGLFSLGMFTTGAEQWGSVTGLISGIILALVMAFGKHPSPIPLPRSTEKCYVNSTIILSLKKSASEYSWFFRVSYMYYGLFGLLTTLIVGYSVSMLVRLTKKRTIESENYNPDLFVPPLAKRLRKKADLFNLTKLGASQEDLRNGNKTQ